MKNLRFISSVFLLILLANNFATAKGQDSSDDKVQIGRLLSRYESALNESSTKDVIPLYAEDGVFMPTQAPIATGPEQLTASYDHVFATIKLSIKFTVEELVVSGRYAFAKTGSKGKVTVVSSGIQQPEENRELFVFRKDKGEWKISRYMFNKAK